MRIGSITFLTISLLASSAFAVARHDRPDVKVAGSKAKPEWVIKMTVYPESYANVRIGLGKMKATIPSGTGDPGTFKRELGAGKRPGYLRLKLGEKKGLTNKPYEMIFKVPFKKGGLKPGDQVDVVSAFFNANSYFHIFGMFDGPVQQGDRTSVIKLPDIKKK